jgi:hypothetical protein
MYDQRFALYFADAQVLKRGAERGELVNIALNTHGTRAVQKLIETLSSREQRQIVIQALEGGERMRGMCRSCVLVYGRGWVGVCMGVCV